MKTVENVNVQGKVILVRTDYNVTIKDGEVVNDLRLRASLPTINYLQEHGAKKIVLISHCGRPDGKKVPELSLAPVVKRLAELLGVPVEFVSDVAGPDVEQAALNGERILLLENLRFYPGEEQNSAEFAHEIIESTHAELFVEDGFAVIHRAHASTVAIAEELPAVAGLLVEKEVATLRKTIESPTRPLLVIVGGAKVADKQPLIDKFVNIADYIFVGGKIAADGYRSDNAKIIVATDFSDATKKDIGNNSVRELLELIDNARAVIWNGTLGQTEQPPYDQASKLVAEAVSKVETSVICGGDTTGFVETLSAEASSETPLLFTLVSTGGGASLELLLGLPLPGLDVLE